MGKKVEQIARNPKTNADGIKTANDMVTNNPVNKMLTGSIKYDYKTIHEYFGAPSVYAFKEYTYLSNTDSRITFHIDELAIKKPYAYVQLNTSSSFFGLTIGVKNLRGRGASMTLHGNDKTLLQFSSNYMDENYAINLSLPKDKLGTLAYTYEVPKYQHTITLTSTSNPTLMFCFTTLSSNNNPIDSLTDLITNLANTSYQGIGSYQNMTLAYIHIGTTSNDTTFKNTNNQPISLSVIGFTNVADEVTTIS